MEDDTKSQNSTQKAVPSDLSDHDERSEGLATEKHWDEETPKDPAAVAASRLKDFHDQGEVIYNEEDSDKFEDSEEMPEHINEELEESLDEMADKEKVEEE